MGVAVSLLVSIYLCGIIVSELHTNLIKTDQGDYGFSFHV